MYAFQIYAWSEYWYHQLTKAGGGTRLISVIQLQLFELNQRTVTLWYEYYNISSTLPYS